jgi:hypothetical protein
MHTNTHQCTWAGVQPMSQSDGEIEVKARGIRKLLNKKQETI